MLKYIYSVGIGALLLVQISLAQNSTSFDVNDLKISQDVAGATFMAMATSVPELSVNVISTFITENDLGMGTVVGSAVFNTLGVAACSGLAATQVIKLSWWPLTRDSSIYIVVLCTLIVVVWDEEVRWYEATVLILLYLIYFILMFANTQLHKGAKKVVKTFSTSKQDLQDVKSVSCHLEVPLEGTYRPHAGSVIRAKLSATEVESTVEKPKSYFSTLSSSKGGTLMKIWWLFKLPIVLVLFITVPDCRHRAVRRLYPLTFLMCVVWIGIAAYIISWMITVIGDTFEIPDSVMGMTLSAIGGCLPETIASVILVRQGEGSMGISNSIGASTLDILMCLGLPWLIKTLMHNEPVKIISSGMSYNCLALLGLIIVFYLVVLLFRFHLSRRLGVTCLVLYAIYIVFAVLEEMNTFFFVNPPICGWE
ncbi:sodium/potassium/calcium exchanger 5 isoform X2 [Anabrus simplex]|uniref:sodium/potassium/calcium exchanger 5 isoform X2 n=1 Tax=Anabrus simplex TaxID=316456 RepID=UPI0035A282E9